MRKSFKANLIIIMTILLIVTSIAFQLRVEAAGAADCRIPGDFSAIEQAKAKKYIKQLSIPESSNGKSVNLGFLLNKCGLGQAAVVYGSPLDIPEPKNTFDEGQWRYLGWDNEGNLYRNWEFRSDSRATLNVAKNWVKEPWRTTIGKQKRIEQTKYSFNTDLAASYLKDMNDPYNELKTFLQSYNKRKGTNWTGYDLLDYAIIQQPRTDFSPGIVQMWNIWEPDGSWWYEMFDIPPDIPDFKEEPDLIISNLVAQADAWVGDSVPVKITTKNEGETNSGPFTVGIIGTTIKSEIISNIPPGQIKTVTVNVSSSSSGIKTFTAKTDFGEAVAESNESNNLKDFKIAFNKKNEPTTPIAIISHKEGDHRTTPEITMKPAAEPMLDDKLSYSPGKETITLREWKYKTPAGKTFAKKPAAKDFTAEGKYLVELRVTNAAKKVSEWAQLIVNVGTMATPNPSPIPTPTPKPDLVADVEFIPPIIIAGETSSLINHSKGYSSHTWKFSDNLSAVLPNNTDYEYDNQRFLTAGYYTAEITVTDEFGGSKKDIAVLQVIDKQPIAVVNGISRVVQGRPLQQLYDLLSSYTPLEEYGERIDFSKSEMRYKKIGDSSYANGWFTQTPAELGQYSMEGRVYDTSGRLSDWDALIMEVVPDVPPLVEVTAPTESYRGNDFMLYIDAISPDGDILKHLLLEERYDRNGNGSFEDEAWKTLYNGGYKTTHSLNYNAVGKRQYRAVVTEAFGMKGYSLFVTTDILNYAPSVNFNVFGTTQQPGQGEDSGPPVTNYTPESIFRSWAVKTPYTGGAGSKLGWKNDASSLSTKKSVFADFYIGYPNMGLGSNSRSRYNFASDIMPQTAWKDYGIIEAVFAGHRIYSIGSGTTTDTIYEKNAITGAVLRSFSIAKDNFTYRNIDKKENLYYYYDDNRTIYVRVYNNQGVLIGEHSIPPDYSDTSLYMMTNMSMRYFEVSPDGRYLYMMTTQRYQEQTWHYIAPRVFKYDLVGRNVVWNNTGRIVTYNRMIYNQIKGTITSNGDFIVTYAIEYLNDGTSHGWVILGRNNGVVSYAELEYVTDISYPTISDDGQHIYVTTSTQSANNKYFSSDLVTIPVMATSFDDHKEATLENWEAGQVLFDGDDRSGIGTPIVRPDGNVYVTTKVNYGDKLSNRYGDLIASNGYSDKAHNYKMFYLPDGRTAVPSISNPYIDNGRKLYTDLNIYTWVPNIDYRPNPPIARYRSVNAGGTMTPVISSILPDGSIYFFSGDGTVIPYVSTTIVNGGSSGLKGIDSDTVEITNDAWGGLLYDAGSSMKNYAFEFNASVNDINNDKVIGAGFQIQNEKNMYSMEWSKNTVSLYRVVNGAKTLLQSTPMARTAFSTYPIKVESINGVQRVYINHSKVLEVADGTYTRGYAGLMSLGQSNSVFSNVKKTNYGDTYTEQTYDTVLVNEPITYEKRFNDIEKDSIGAEEWSYSHNPKFFENPEVLSIHNGKTYGSTINALERAGVYEITFRAKDNPGLSAYSKWSEPVKKLLYVHRRPVAQPDVRFTGRVFAEGEALDYETYDKSYDPDIAHLLSDKVFRTRWADQSTWTAGKREYYNRPGVELIVQEQVRDIHGAWSYWGQTIVYKEVKPSVNQTKPVMTITYPTGTTTGTPTVLIKEPTIRWTYYDKENDLQEKYRLSFTYVDTNEAALYIEHEGSTLTYPMLGESIVPGRVVKVQGQVFSAGVWSNLSNIRYFVLDLPPQTYLQSFNGPDENNPIYSKSNRPRLQVFTVDPENHSIAAIDYEVFNASSGAKVVDTNSATSAATYNTTALAEGLHYWRARANDSYLWGPYSSNGFFFVDTKKPADVNEQLEVEPTAVTVKFNAFSDPEPSSGHARRIFYLQQVNKDGSFTNIDLNGDGSNEDNITLALNKLSYKVNGLLPGREYRVLVLDYDIAGNEGYHEYIHFFTNRPPTGNFDWSPKPVYEGDMTSFLSNVEDADGNMLTIAYELTNPFGEKSNYLYVSNGPSYPAKGPSLRLTSVGLWSMKMTVSDGIADPVSLTKSLQVLPLHINGYVRHTELWDQYRKAFNLKQSGDENEPRGSSVFWAGEKFILEADTTQTGTATKADRVVVRMGSYETSLESLGVDQASWGGELWDEAFAKLPEGTLTFTFYAYYNNGTVKSTSVDVAIDSQTLAVIGVHRIQ